MVSAARAPWIGNNNDPAAAAAVVPMKMRLEGADSDVSAGENLEAAFKRGRTLLGPALGVRVPGHPRAEGVAHRYWAIRKDRATCRASVLIKLQDPFLNSSICQSASALPPGSFSIEGRSPYHGKVHFI